MLVQRAIKAGRIQILPQTPDSQETRLRNAANSEHSRRRAKQRRDAIAAGICYLHTTRPVKTLPGRHTCEECRAKAKEASRRHDQEKRKPQRKKNP